VSAGLLAATALAAALAWQAAGLAYGIFASVAVPAPLAWPWRVVQAIAAVLAYGVVSNACAEIVNALLTKRRPDRGWPARLLDGCSLCVIAASLALGVAAIVDARAWTVLLAAMVPAYVAYRAYSGHVARLDGEQRHRKVLQSLDEGMCALDSDGCVRLLNEAFTRVTGCPPDQIIGRRLALAMPALHHSALPRVIADAQRDSQPRTEQVRVSSDAGWRTLQVKIVPADGELRLFWHDVTGQRLAETALKRAEERLALAGDGAGVGLWEWDRRSNQFYRSGRWREMVGLEATADTVRAEDWFDRVHPDDLAPLKAALEAHMSGSTAAFEHEHRLRHEDGTHRRFLCRGVAVRGAGSGRAVRIGGSLCDTTDHRQAQEHLRRSGEVDSLTGLCNRTLFVDGLGRRLDEYKRHRHGSRFAVLYLDLDRFKIVNDSLGHLVGDELLIAVSRRLEKCLRQGDALARLGGDEFAILLDGLTDEQQANVIAFRIQDALSTPFAIGGREVFTSASIGIACGLPSYSNPEEIMRDADTAMYHAKSRGKARHEMFDADMHARAKDRLGLENDLRRAVAANDFEVHYQPIVLLSSGMCVGFESLVRWRRDGKPVPPATFIPIAEELGLIDSIGTWVLREACRTFADWQRRYPDSGLDCITVNVSGRQLAQQHFLNTVEQALHAARLRAGSLRLEITETALMDSPVQAAATLRELRNVGVKIYLDDFGTGFSSLSHLHKLPVDALKIDRSFVKSLLIPDRPAIVESILALARTLNTSVVAEGIEAHAEAEELERLGCTHAQGYLFSRPLSTENAEALIAAAAPLGTEAFPVLQAVV